MLVRPAKAEEYEKVSAFYDTVIEGMKGKEFKPGWETGVYPAPEFLRSSVENGELYIGEEDGRWVAAMVLNHSVTDGYETVRWAVDAAPEEVLVVHALCTLPGLQGKGVARELMGHVLRIAREMGQKAIRLDVLNGNVPALRLYTSVGFEYRDTIKLFYEDTGLTDFLLYEYVI